MVFNLAMATSLREGNPLIQTEIILVSLFARAKGYIYIYIYIYIELT